MCFFLQELKWCVVNWFIYCRFIIRACPWCCWLCLMLSELFWIYYSLIQSTATWAFCCLGCEIKKKKQSGSSAQRAQQCLWNCSGQHFSGIILFGDLNAFAPRQLLIKGLDVPDMPAELVGDWNRKAGEIAVTGCYSGCNIALDNFFTFIYLFFAYTWKNNSFVFILGRLLSALFSSCAANKHSWQKMLKEPQHL